MIEELKNENKVKEYVDKALSKSTTIYFGCQTPSWIRSKLDAHPGNTVTVYGIPKRRSKKAPYNLVEGYAVIDRKRVYNGDYLCFDGNNWIILSRM